MAQFQFKTSCTGVDGMSDSLATDFAASLGLRVQGDEALGLRVEGAGFRV